MALFRTHELQKDGMVIFFLWCFRKVRFRKLQFLKDGVQTVDLDLFIECFFFFFFCCSFFLFLFYVLMNIYFSKKSVVWN